MAMPPLTLPARKLEGEHTHHARHLCELTARRNMREVAKLAKDAQYLCHICGRAAAKAENLCEPVKI